MWSVGKKTEKKNFFCGFLVFSYMSEGSKQIIQKINYFQFGLGFTFLLKVQYQKQMQKLLLYFCKNCEKTFSHHFLIYILNKKEMPPHMFSVFYA